MKKLLFILLLVFAFLERTVFDLGPNIEIVTASIILASFYLGRKYALLLIFLIMVTSDLIIGNTSIFIFTWSGFLIPTLLVSLYFKKFRLSSLKKYFTGLGLGLGTNIFFFIWTNFGVWLLDAWGMYPKTLSGLIFSYINGFPFLKMQMISSLVFVPLGFLSIDIAVLLYKNLSKKHRFDFKRLV